MKLRQKEELHKAILTIEDIVQRSEKAKEKFVEGSAQFSLLTNRIHGMQLAHDCIVCELTPMMCTTSSIEEYQKALAPIVSIHQKCSKSMHKMKEESYQYRRLHDMVEAMDIAVVLVQQHLDEKSV